MSGSFSGIAQPHLCLAPGPLLRTFQLSLVKEVKEDRAAEISVVRTESQASVSAPYLHRPACLSVSQCELETFSVHMNITEFDQQSSFTFAGKEVEVRRERQSETGEGGMRA